VLCVSEDDAIVINRVNTTTGQDAALAEVRRRWPGLTERAATEVLGRILQVPTPPPARFRGRRSRVKRTSGAT